MNFVYLKRLKDGQILDVPEDQAEETLKRGEFVRLPNMIINHDIPQPVDFQCPLCDQTFTSDHGLKVHKASHV